MTVSELIALLSDLPPQAHVIFHDEEMAVDDGGRVVAQIDELGALIHVGPFTRARPLGEN